MDERLKYKLVPRGKSKTVILRNYGNPSVNYIYNVKQAAEFCECTDATIRRWVKVGLLPALKSLEGEEDIPAVSNPRGKLYFLKQDLVNALRVGLGVPTEGFNVEDNPRDGNVH